MTDTITVASRAHTSVLISEPMPYVEPGKPMPVVSSAHHVIHGARHPSAVGEEGITDGVPADMFRKWHEANKGTPLGDALREVSGDDLKNMREHKIEYGFQPGLDRLKNEHHADAEKGSTVTHEGPVTSEEMAATSDVPNDDSPRSQVGQN